MDRFFEFKAYVTVRATRESQARRVLEAALAEVANTIVNGDLGIDIAFDESPPVDVTEDWDRPHV